MNRNLIRILYWFCMVSLIGLFNQNEAGADFYVIAAGRPAKRIVMVSPKRTAAESGASLLRAIDKITTASATNPYLVVLEPGIYDIGDNCLYMNEFVHLQGSGQDATVITSTVSTDDFPASRGTLVMTQNTSLKDLTLVNNATSGSGIALLIPAGVSQSEISDVNARAQGNAAQNYGVHVMGIGGAINISLLNVNSLAENATEFNVGIRNYYDSTLTLRGGSFTGRGGETAYGITNAADNTLLVAENVMALAENGEITNYGLTNGEASVDLIGGSFTARGGANTKGIFNYTRSIIKAVGIKALGEAGTEINSALENAMAEAILNGGFFTALGGTDAKAIYNRRNTAKLQAVGVTALAKDSTGFNRALCNEDEAEAELQGGAFTGRGGANTYGIYNEGENTHLESHDVEALGENGTVFNRGIMNSTDATALLHGGSFIARGGGAGIQNYVRATLETDNVYALAEGSDTYNDGLINTSDSTAILRGGSFIARDGTSRTRGIYIYGTNTTLKASGIYAAGEDGGYDYGLVISSGTADVMQSTLEGTSASADRNGGTLMLKNCRLEGGDVSGTATCVAVSWGMIFYENTCP